MAGAAARHGDDVRRPLLARAERQAGGLQVGHAGCAARDRPVAHRLRGVRVLRGQLRLLRQDLRHARRPRLPARLVVDHQRRAAARHGAQLRARAQSRAGRRRARGPPRAAARRALRRPSARRPPSRPNPPQSHPRPSRRTSHGYPEPIRLGDRQRQGAGAGEGAGSAGEAQGRRPAGPGAHARAGRPALDAGRRAGQRHRGGPAETSRQLREQGQDAPAQAAEKVADHAERLGGYLSESNADRILGDLEDFGRRQPLAVIALGVAAGFAASRFLKASSRQRYEGRLSRDAVDDLAATRRPRRRPGSARRRPRPAGAPAADASTAHERRRTGHAAPIPRDQSIGELVKDLAERDQHAGPPGDRPGQGRDDRAGQARRQGRRDARRRRARRPAGRRRADRVPHRRARPGHGDVAGGADRDRASSAPIAAVLA